MDKYIKDKEIKNQGRKSELEKLFLYELLFELEKKVSPEEIIIYFNKEYNYNLSNKECEQLSDKLKTSIEKIRKREAGFHLMKLGYESEEF